MNKKKQAVALRYKPETDKAPIIVAKGSGYLADTILEKAKEFDVPVQEDPSLVEVLGKLDVQQQIPAELYQVVAEVLAFVYQTDQKAKNRLSRS